jgi:integrase/recombinase XerD
LLGHRSILTTARYTHLTAQTAGRTAERIEALMARLNIDWGTL